jgi:formamidopyrimidine-DNA glycosylase
LSEANLPELPEVETTIRGLKKEVLKRAFVDVWSDNSKTIRKPKKLNFFKKQIRGKKIREIRRRGKNIILELSEGKALLVHQKMTGHLLYGSWSMKHGTWKSRDKGPLEDKMNSYIHLIFTLDNGQMLALSDLRKFAKVELWDSKKLKKELDFSLGAEPLEKSFTFRRFQEILVNQKRRIKKVLMDQKLIAGIGNIYSDEILWDAKIHPFQTVDTLNDDELRRIFKAIKKILKKAIKMHGTSTADYRDATGKKGSFGKALQVYRKEKERCSRCGQLIQRKKISGRSAHFCPKCQPISN